MYPLSSALFSAALATVGVSATASDACEALRLAIESRIRAAGVAPGFSLTTVDSSTGVAGEVVGTCAQGARRIVYLKSGKGALPAPVGAVASTPSVRASTAPAAPSPPPPFAAPADESVLTECKPGFISIRGDCKKL